MNGRAATWVGWILVAFLVVTALGYAVQVFQLSRQRPRDAAPGLRTIATMADRLASGAVDTRPLGTLRAELLALRDETSNEKSRKTLDHAVTALAGLDVQVETREQLLATQLLEMRKEAETISTLLGRPVALDRLAGIAAKDIIHVVAWPFVVIAAVLAFVLLPEVPSAFESLQTPLLGLKLRRPAAGQTAEASIRKLRQETTRMMDDRAKRHTVSEIVARILEAKVVPYLQSHTGLVPPYRCTIHVKDALFAESLYQLIDYLPEGGNHGRAWSIRYGMIGKQFRLEESAVNGTIPTDHRTLIRDWGMTATEAAKPGRQSMVAIALKPKPNGQVLGVLFLDAAGENAFCAPGKENELIGSLEAACQDYGLIQALSQIESELETRKAPHIRIYGT